MKCIEVMCDIIEGDEKHTSRDRCKTYSTSR